MKYVLLALVVGLAAWIWQRGRASPPADRPGPARPGAGPGAARVSEPAEMLRCVTCGTHLPRTEALLEHGRVYCSPACRDAAGG